MVVGVDTRCCKCHTPMRSCVLPAYCHRCRSTLQELRETLAVQQPDQTKVEETAQKVAQQIEENTDASVGGVNPLITEQQPPADSFGDCWNLVMKDMEDRRRHGIEKYGKPVQPFNGRDSLVDLYQELLDACVYLRQVIEERRLAGSGILPPEDLPAGGKEISS